MTEWHDKIADNKENTMRKIKGNNGGTLHVLEKGETRNPNGRPRKFVCVLKEQGYKLSEVNDTIQIMMSMTVDELKAVWSDPRATVLEKTVAAAIKKSIGKGSLYSIETLLTRVFGRPKETVEEKGEQKITVEYVNNLSKPAS